MNKTIRRLGVLGITAYKFITCQEPYTKVYGVLRFLNTSKIVFSFSELKQGVYEKNNF
ncbi:hypothetical protein J4221_04780 [Candidatus Pacearchaeota archaeon]|nr:hypothetical protein [Candidatus Pacearchaeota archaeon]